MKKIIITKNQYTNLKEELSSTTTKDDVPIIDATAESTSDVPTAGQEMADKVRANGGTAAKIRVTPKTATPTNNLELSGQGDTAREQFTDAIESANKSGLDKDNVSYTVTLGNDGLPVQNEGRLLSKASVEVARLNSLRESSVLFKKKHLLEAVNTGNSEIDEARKKINSVMTQCELSMELRLSDYKKLMDYFLAKFDRSVNDIKDLLSSLNLTYTIKTDIKDWGDDSQYEIKFITNMKEEDLDDATDRYIYNYLDRGIDLTTEGSFVAIRMHGYIPYVNFNQED